MAIALKTKSIRHKKRVAFYCIMLSLPLLQFLIFYVYVNFSNMGMAFVKYKENPNGLGYISFFAGLQNFASVFKRIGERSYMIRNSLIFFLVHLFIGISLTLVFSFFISKKFLGHKLFKVILFLPQIVSTVVFALIFKYLADSVYPSMLNKLYQKDVIGLISNPDTKVQFITVLIYSIFIEFGANVLLFTGSMSAINESIIEAAKLDGCNSWLQ